MKALPPCCYPRAGAESAELLYCIYQAAGPASRAGLAWNGKPCPTWPELVEQANGDDARAVSAAAVVDKWRAVASAAGLKAPPSMSSAPR